MLYWEHGCSLQLSLIIKLASTTKNFFLPGRATWLHFDSELKFFPLYFCVAFLAVLALCCYAHFSLVAASRAYSNCGAWASHGSGFSCCRAWALEYGFQSLWLMGLAALRHMGSSRTRDQTQVPCIGRLTPIHCTTGEVSRVS